MSVLAIYHAARFSGLNERYGDLTTVGASDLSVAQNSQLFLRCPCLVEFRFYRPVVAV